MSLSSHLCALCARQCLLVRGFPLAPPSAFHYGEEVTRGAVLYTVLHYMQRCSDLIYSLSWIKIIAAVCFGKLSMKGVQLIQRTFNRVLYSIFPGTVLITLAYYLGGS